MSSFNNSSARRQLAEMKQTLSLARIARDDVRAAHATAVQRLEAARAELATIMRRRELARGISDDETVAVAERFAASQQTTIELLERKVAVLHDELVLTERTVADMELDLRSVTGIGPKPSAAGADAATASDPTVDPSDYRALDDAVRAQSADDRLAELKRRMGRA